MPSDRGPRSLSIPSTDGVTLEVHDLDGDGPPLLLAHATGFHGLVWAPLFSHLTGFRGLSPDFRAHGGSSAPADRDLDWNGFADDVLAVVDAVSGDEPLDGLGHSMGGAALLLAEQRRPGTFRTLYLFEPVVFPPELAAGMDGDNFLAVGARRRRSQFPSRDAAFDNYAAKPPFSVLDPTVLRAYVDHGFADVEGPDGTVVELRCRPDDEARIYENGTSHDGFAHLAEVKCPVTIARGRTDPGPSGFAERLVALIPNARLEVFDELGHFGPLEDPATVAASVQRAFER